MHDEREQAELIKRQRDANKAYGMSASNGMGDETESQVEAIHFVSSQPGKVELEFSEAGFDREDEAQAKFLLEEGKWQERTEKAFCWGMLVGGAVALAVYNLTLWLVGLL